ncbi:putative aliphatic sulfonates transport permease protein SsuC [bioreactor metagenome]|uniref:NitT/TauT family transport system permease protein n=2 Tax=root TaxID=1 RepID=A0A562JE52_9FIRM|nr:ABC transporter permease [Sedimentibacter saalensis]TWH81408.1 NitT/TauT family transport system permease protein [Sedimentibacter saalensis]
MWKRNERSQNQAAISKEHEQYLKNLKKEKDFIKITQVMIFAVFIVLWEAAARYRLIDTFLTSSPGAIFELIVKFVKDGSLFNHLYVSTTETIAGFFTGTILGFFVSILLWWFEKLARITDPYMVILNSLPKTALAPIIILWAGMGFSGIVVTAASISVIVTIMTLYTGFINVEKDKIVLLKTLGANKFQILKKVIIPSNIPNIMSVIKVNIGLSWIGVIVGEFLVSKAGIGYLILYGSQTFKLDLVMMGVFILGLIAAVMYFFAAWLEKKVIKY